MCSFVEVEAFTPFKTNKATRVPTPAPGKVAVVFGHTTLPPQAGGSRRCKVEKSIFPDIPEASLWTLPIAKGKRRARCCADTANRKGEEKGAVLRPRRSRGLGTSPPPPSAAQQKGRRGGSKAPPLVGHRSFQRSHRSSVYRSLSQSSFWGLSVSPARFPATRQPLPVVPGQSSHRRRLRLGGIH